MFLGLKNYIIRFIAFRYFNAKVKDRFISLITRFSITGIALGVATLIVVMSVMKGYEIKLIEKIVGMDGHISIYTADKLEDKVSKKITYNKHVSGLFSVINGQAVISTEASNSGVKVHGMLQQDLAKKLKINIEDNANFKHSIFISKRFAYEHGIYKGEKIKLIVPEIQQSIMGAFPKTKTFVVAGFFESGLYHYDVTNVFISQEIASLLFQGSLMYEIQLHSHNSIDAVKNLLLNYLPSDAMITDVMQSNQNVIEALQIERTVMMLILSLMILIAAFNIITGMVMLVKEKGTDIAVLATVGVKKIEIVKIFFLTTILISVVGISIGVTLGLLVSYNLESIRLFLESFTGFTIFDPVIYFLYQIPSEVVLSDIAKIVIFSFIISVLSGLYPAYRAYRIAPAKLLRMQ